MDENATETDQVAKLLADVQRTIRENQQFIKSLKADDADFSEDAEDSQQEAVADDEEDYEEL